MDWKDKLVLVWDLDLTLIASYNSAEKNTIDIVFNPSAIHILKESKKNPKVLANFLLTNNSDKNFIDRVSREITEKFGIENPFDTIYHAKHPKRLHLISEKNTPIRPGYAVKSIYDVKNMLEDIGYTFEGFEYKELLDYGKEHVYFFDDRDDHQLCYESKFIHITPPFQKDQQDKTDYSQIQKELGIDEFPITQTAGKRKTRKQKENQSKRKTKKQKQKKNTFLSTERKKRKTY